MRDYPSVPNVFRVASSQSVNSEDNYLLSMSASKGPTAHVRKGNAAMNAEQTAAPKDCAPKHQQQRQSMQQQAGFESDALQPRSATMPPIASQQEPQLQRRFHYLGAPMAPMFNNQSAQRQNTTLSMERPTCRNGGAGHQEQYSPYGTLPRFLQGVSNGDLHKQQQRQQLSNDATVAGLINTISGSIPSTGVGVDSRATSKRNEPNGNIRSSESGVVNKTSNMRNQQQRPCVKYCSSRAERQNGAYLWILTPVAASISVAIVVAALAGPQWLFTEEKLPNTNYNGTANFNVLDDGAFITKYTKSSLWILCTTLQGVDTYNCIKIDYFPKEGYQPDPHDSTPAIPYTVTRSCPFFLVAGLFLLVSFIVFLIPTCSQQSSLYYFSAGIMFIVSGLLMLIGLIVYISILKAEIGSKLRPRSTLQPALFKVTYGQSFFLFVFGFIATEFVGLMNIFLYISLQEVDYYSVNRTNRLEDTGKLKLQMYPWALRSTQRLKHELSSDFKAPPASRYGKRHQVHDAGFLASLKPEVASDEKTLFQQVTSHVCRKHPNTAASNFLMEEDLENRYYFEKPPLMPKCNLHSKNLAKSLNELYTEPALPVGPPPPPSAIKMGAARTLPRLQQDPSRFGSVPQEFPLTRSVSTTTELYTNDGLRSESNNLKTSSLHVERRNCRNMATNTQLSAIEIARREKELVKGQQLSEYDYDMEPPQRLCGLKRGTIRKTKEELFHEFCKRSGVRPKPKNIYYISNEDEGSKGSKGRERTDGTEALELNAIGNETRACREEQYDAECKQLLLQDDEEHIYVVEDNPNYLLVDPSRNLRRASMYVEPTHLRKLSSDLSLQTLYAPEKSHQMSLLDLEKCAHNRNAFGGSEDRLCQAYNAQINASRTLPHSFKRRSTDSLDSMGSASLQASTHALQSAYCVSRNRLSSLMLQHQQQQQQRQYLQQRQQPRVGGLHHSSLALNRTSEHPGVGGTGGTYASVACSQHQQPPATARLASSSQDSSTQQASVQWPAVIPSSPSAFASRYQMYAPMPDAHMHPHSLLTRSTSGGGKNAAIGAMAQPKFQRRYAFDEQRRSSSIVAEAFDLDEIERERRRSHASLFSGTSFSAIDACNSNNNAEHYDLINGTAV